MRWQSNGPEGAVLRDLASRVVLGRDVLPENEELIRLLSSTVSKQEFSTMVHRLQRRTCGLSDLWETFLRSHDQHNLDPHSHESWFLLQFLCIAIARNPERVKELKGPHQPFMLVALEVACTAAHKAQELQAVKAEDAFAVGQVENRTAQTAVPVNEPVQHADTSVNSKITSNVCASLNAVLARDAQHESRRSKNRGTRSGSLASKSTASSNDSSVNDNHIAPFSSVQSVQDGDNENPVEAALNSTAAMWLGPEPETPGNSPAHWSSLEPPPAFTVPATLLITEYQ